MNVRYAKSLQEYFSDHVSDIMFDPSAGIYDTYSLWNQPCGCFGVHSAYFNRTYVQNGDRYRWFFRDGIRDNEGAGITKEMIVEAMVSLTGDDDARDEFDPYGNCGWVYSPDKVVGEMIRIYEEQNSEVM